MRNSGIKDYFHFTKGERVSVFWLLVLIVAVIVIKQFFVDVAPKKFNRIPELAVLQLKLDSLEKADSLKYVKVKPFENDTNIKLTHFEPNDLSKQDWQNFGLSEKQAQVILNYKEKSNGFKSKKQVKRMFVISDELYTKLEPFILLPDSIEKETFKKFEYENKWEKKEYTKSVRVLPKVLINTADTADFKKLYGIGDVLAQRIVETREQLGGFRSKAQLKEIWGLKPEVLLNLDTQLIFNKVNLRKLNINSATKDELKAHPYLYWKHANAIVNYRKQHGKYKKLEDLKKVILIPDSIYNKVSPYLDVN